METKNLTLVIIPAAGDATRLRPVTSKTSKAMVPVGGRPCIDWIMDRFLDQERFQVVIVTHPELDDLDQYVAKNSTRFNHVTTAKQRNYFDKPGPVDAIVTAIHNSSVDDRSNVIVWLGDTILHPAFQWHARQDWKECDLDHDDAAVRFFVGEVDDSSQWCVYDDDSGRVLDKPEHPVERPRALVGVYEWRYLKDLRAAVQGFDHEEPPEISDLILDTHNRKSNNGMYFADVSEHWLDIGQLHTYYETNARLLESKSRAFNEIHVDTFLGSITKQSPERPEILEPEREWYNRLDTNQQRFVPRIWRNEPGVLEMDLESGVLLSDVLVWDRLPQSTWRWIIYKIVDVMDQMFWQQGDVIDAVPMEPMWIEKSRKRLLLALESGFFNEREFDQLNKISCQMVSIAGDHEVRSKRYIHGDLHSGNVLFDFNTGHVKFIDPRGEWPGIPVRTTAGDWLYDWAKLAHDFKWGYSAILADREMNVEAQKAFSDIVHEWFSDDPGTVTMINHAGLLLLATCIPLHDDDPQRQKRMARAVQRALHYMRKQ